MNFQNVRLRPLLCAVLSVILVTGSMILPAFAAEQNVNFSYVDSVPSATVAPTKLEDFNVHNDTIYSSGAVVTGRICYDAFVLDNKKKGIYYQATT